MRRLMTRPVGYVVAVVLIVVGLMNQTDVINSATGMWVAGVWLLTCVGLTHSVVEEPDPDALTVLDVLERTG